MWTCWMQPSDRVCLCVYTLAVCVCVRLSEGQDRNSCHLNQPFPFRLVPTESDGFKSRARKTKTGSKKKKKSDKKLQRWQIYCNHSLHQSSVFLTFNHSDTTCKQTNDHLFTDLLSAGHHTEWEIAQRLRTSVRHIQSEGGDSEWVRDKRTRHKKRSWVSGFRFHWRKVEGAGWGEGRGLSAGYHEVKER